MTADVTEGRLSRRALLGVAGTATASTLAGCPAFRKESEREFFYGGGWYSYGNGQRNANHATTGAPEPTGQDLIASASWPYAPPVVYHGLVYFAAGRRVVSVTSSGTEQWSRRLDGTVSGAPALDAERERLYVPTRTVDESSERAPERAGLTVLSLAGDVSDRLRVGDGRAYGVTVADGALYVRSASACVRVAPDGTERWRERLDALVYDEYNLGDGTATQVAPAVTDDAVYVPDRDALVKLDRQSGERQWQVPVDTAYAAAVATERGVVQTGAQETVGVDHSGEVRWRRDVGSRASAGVADGDVYLAGSDLYELDEVSGETNWQTALPSNGTAAPVVTDEDVLVATSDSRAYRRETGGAVGPDRERWRASDVAVTPYASPVVGTDRLLTVGPDGLRALRADAED